MKNELGNVVSKTETFLQDIKKIQKRIEKLNELAEQAENENRETKGYDYARTELEDRINKIIADNRSIIEKLVEIKTKLEREKEEKENEKLKKLAMLEVEKALSKEYREQTEIDKLENEIQKIQERQTELEDLLQRVYATEKRIESHRIMHVSPGWIGVSPDLVKYKGEKLTTGQ